MCVFGVCVCVCVCFVYLHRFYLFHSKIFSLASSEQIYDFYKWIILKTKDIGK